VSEMRHKAVTGVARAQVEARVLDLSLGGALLHVAAAFEVGAISDFAVPLDAGSIWVQAEVKRCTPANGGYDIGLEFVGMHPQDHRRLVEYLARPR
jgi:c-di-GMP-binding flagellar brake protein YcgR